MVNLYPAWLALPSQVNIYLPWLALQLEVSIIWSVCFGNNKYMFKLYRNYIDIFISQSMIFLSHTYFGVLNVIVKIIYMTRYKIQTKNTNQIDQHQDKQLNKLIFSTKLTSRCLYYQLIQFVGNRSIYKLTQFLNQVNLL